MIGKSRVERKNLFRPGSYYRWVNGQIPVNLTKKSPNHRSNSLLNNRHVGETDRSLGNVTFSICRLASCDLAVLVLSRSLVKHLRVVVLAGLGGANRVSPPSPLCLYLFWRYFLRGVRQPSGALKLAVGRTAT